jgi:hypothetical protein
LSPQASLDARIRTTFVDERLKPDICSTHASVNVHPVADVTAPVNWKAPTRKPALASFPQQIWNAALAAPAVAVPKSRTRYPTPEAATAKEMPL